MFNEEIYVKRHDNIPTFHSYFNIQNLYASTRHLLKEILVLWYQDKSLVQGLEGKNKKKDEIETIPI